MALRKPMRSVPVMGCPPTKSRVSPCALTWSCIGVFTDPISVSMVPSDRYGFSSSTLALLKETGAHRKMISQSEKASPSSSAASSTTPHSMASSTVLLWGAYALIYTGRMGATLSRRAWAMEPPMRPSPTKPQRSGFVSSPQVSNASRVTFSSSILMPPRMICIDTRVRALR